MNQLTPAQTRQMTATASEKEQVFVTIYVNGQLFGMPVERVQDILVPEKIAEIPLSPPEVAGAINLRGRIVTVVNVRTRLGLPPKEGEKMCTTVEPASDLYSLSGESVCAVVRLSRDRIDPNPRTLDPRWRQVSSGVVRLEDKLMIVMDIDSLLDFEK